MKIECIRTSTDVISGDSSEIIDRDISFKVKMEKKKSLLDHPILNS